MASVYIGQRILIEIEYRLSGVPTDPTLATITARSPAGSVSTLTYPDEDFVRRSAGLFEASILVDEPGTWVFRTEGAGVVDAVNEYTQVVLQSGLSG